MKDWIGKKVQVAVSSPTGIWLRNWMGLRGASRSNHEIHGISVPADVVVYFSDVAAKAYQLEQWLPVLERLNRDHKVLLVFRKVGALRELRRRTSLSMIFARRFDDVMELFDANDYSLGIYVNNGVNNFQSLTFARMVHVHVNHGESDKLSMVSNQVKAYDKVFIAGPAALERHRSVLLDFDESKLVMVGRPQLDLDYPPELEPSALRTVMYAPTWEGENESNNYTSLDVYGRQIVDALLALPDTRVVYKPHPRVASSPNRDVAQAHEEIVRAIEEANIDRQTPHIVSEQGNILAMFSGVDGLVTDVSSVGLDFLYLYPERPLVLTDRRTDRPCLERDAPVARSCPVIDGDSVNEAYGLIAAALEQDKSSAERAEVRRFYFGDLAKGDSTDIFVSTVRDLITERRKKLVNHQFHASAGEAADE